MQKLVTQVVREAVVAVQPIGHTYTHVSALFAVSQRDVAYAAAKTAQMKRQAELLYKHCRALTERLRATRALLTQANHGGRASCSRHWPRSASVRV